jgi:hypothetical protein
LPGVSGDEAGAGGEPGQESQGEDQGGWAHGGRLAGGIDGLQGGRQGVGRG